ncbi:MAG: hypothetical protein HWE27_08905 [Gammaproteobacteria bacterium]|nr:hypothetical protein [Gammaproteobacteria bacterium]
MIQSINSLLQYHQSLVSNEFVSRVLESVAHRQLRRSIILSIFTFLGMLSAAVGLTLFMDSLLLSLPSYFNFSPIMISVMVIGLAAIFWDGIVELMAA